MGGGGGAKKTIVEMNCLHFNIVTLHLHVL